MSVTWRGLEATLVAIAAATASSLPSTPPTPSTTSMSDTAVTPSSSTLGRASSSEILFAHHTATAPLTATNTARLSRHSDVPPNSGTRSSGSEHTALPRQTERMLPGSYAHAHAQAVLLNDTVRFYSITDTARTKQETHNSPGLSPLANCPVDRHTTECRSVPANITREASGARPLGISYTLVTSANQGKHGHKHDYGVKH